MDNNLLQSLYKKTKCDEEDDEKIEPKITQGNIDILFAHPEHLLDDSGRNLMSSRVFKKNVVGMVVDEAHCIESWYVVILNTLSHPISIIGFQ